MLYPSDAIYCQSGRCKGGRTTSLNRLVAPKLCMIALMGAACGEAGQSARPSTTTRPRALASLQQVVRTGRLTFKLPSSWVVGYGVCRCGWGTPDTATLDNGPQTEQVICNCPAVSDNAPSGLHLYEGSTGLIPGGKPTVINGLRVLVSVDTSNATATATFPGVDQWITIEPAPRSESRSTLLQQAAIEMDILTTVNLNPSSVGAP